MTKQQRPRPPEPERPLAKVIQENWSDKLELGGSKSSYVACYAANQVLGTIWRGSKEDPDTKTIRDSATLCRISDIGARDVVEAMLAAQMVATHAAAMECFRCGALAEQTFAGRELGLKYGDKLVRSFAVLTDALNRHRGKGQQVVRVEYVTVQAGGQAIVGAVTQGRGRGPTAKRGSSPCTGSRPWPCTAARAAVPGPAAEAHASRRRSRVASVAGCTAGPPAAVPRLVTGTLSSTGATPRSCARTRRSSS